MVEELAQKKLMKANLGCYAAKLIIYVSERRWRNNLHSQSNDYFAVENKRYL